MADEVDRITALYVSVHRPLSESISALRLPRVSYT